MKRKRFSVEQIVGVVKQAEVGVPVAELIRQVGSRNRRCYRWEKQYIRGWKPIRCASSNSSRKKRS